MNLNLKVKNKMNGSNQCRRYGGWELGEAGGLYPLNGHLCPHFGLLKILLLEHHGMTRQQTMMEKEIITSKHNSPLIFFQFFAKLLEINFRHKSDPTFGLIDSPL